jgi:osmotically-inducible protein OsmY
MSLCLSNLAFANVDLEKAVVPVDKTVVPDKTVPKDFHKDKFVTPADDQLNKKIRATVINASFSEVILNTNNGDVTLEGFAIKASNEKDLVRDIQKIEGVKTVKSNLKIKNP